MSDDWEAGDLAICVDIEPHLCCGKYHYGFNLELGRTYRVLNVVRADCGEHVGLIIAERAVIADRFRKIRPDEHNACEPEFVTLLKRTKRRVKA